MKKHWWKWVCEFCYRQTNRKNLPRDWDLVWQCAVCPKCRVRVPLDGGYWKVVCGAYAGKKRDPRAR